MYNTFDGIVSWKHFYVVSSQWMKTEVQLSQKSFGNAYFMTMNGGSGDMMRRPWKAATSTPTSSEISDQRQRASLFPSPYWQP